MNGRYEIRRSNAGFRVVTIGANGEPLAVSEVLESEASARTNVSAQVGVARGYEDKLDIGVIDERSSGDNEQAEPDDDLG